MLDTATAVASRSAGIASQGEIRVVDDVAGFDRLREDWNRIASEMDPPSPMLSWEWSRLWWTRFGGGDSLRIVTFLRGGRVVGIAPFSERRVGVGPIGARILKPIGWEDYGNQGMTETLELLFPPPWRTELLGELALWLRAARVTSAWLPSIGAEESLPDWLADRIAETQPWVSFHHRSLPDDWLDFVQRLNKSMRSNARFYPKRLIRHGHSFELEVAESPAEVSRALPEAIRLHRLRAGADAISRVRHWDHFYRADRIAFLQDVAPILAETGEFKVGLLRVDGAIVAAQTWMERSQTMFMYYTGFEPEWAPYGVQLIATLEALKHGIARGVRRVEFLRGGGHVKERWDTEARVVRNVRCTPNRSLAIAIPAAAAAGQHLRRLRSAARFPRR